MDKPIQKKKRITGVQKNKETKKKKKIQDVEKQDGINPPVVSNRKNKNTNKILDSDECSDRELRMEDLFHEDEF